MGCLADWFARNRRWIGGTVSSIMTGIATIDPGLVAAHPRVWAYSILASGVLFGSGKYKSDKFHRDRQRELRTAA